MWFDQPASFLAVADTTRPILLIVFVLGLFGLAGLGVFMGRKHLAAQNARALSDDTGLTKGAVKGGDGTFSSDWLAEAREDVDDTPRQAWTDVLTLQGVSDVTDSGPSPFDTTTADAASPFGAAPAPDVATDVATTFPAPAQHAPAYPVEAPALPAYETPAYETPAYETPAYESEPTFEASVVGFDSAHVDEPAPYESPEPVVEPVVADEPVSFAPIHVPEPALVEPTLVEPAPYASPEPVALDPLPSPLAAPAAPGEEYATFFGATPPPPPPPPVEPFNIWATETDEH